MESWLVPLKSSDNFTNVYTVLHKDGVVGFDPTSDTIVGFFNFCQFI